MSGGLGKSLFRVVVEDHVLQSDDCKLTLRGVPRHVEGQAVKIRDLGIQRV